MSSIHCSVQRQDWNDRDFIEIISRNIKKITDFLNHFDHSCRGKLAELDEKVTHLERRVDFLEACINGEKSSQLLRARILTLNPNPSMAQLAIRREDEEQAIKRRLFYDGHGSGEDKKIVSLAKSIARLCLVENSDEDFHKLHLNILRDISLIANAADRQLKISARCDRQMTNLERNLEEEEKRFNRVKSELANLELELEYVDKLKRVSMYPDCQTTENAIREVEDKKQQLLVKVVKFRDHISTLLTSCNNLRKILSMPTA